MDQLRHHCSRWNGKIVAIFPRDREWGITRFWSNQILFSLINGVMSLKALNGERNGILFIHTWYVDFGATKEGSQCSIILICTVCTYGTPVPLTFRLGVHFNRFFPAKFLSRCLLPPCVRMMAPLGSQQWFWRLNFYGQLDEVPTPWLTHRVPLFSFFFSQKDFQIASRTPKLQFSAIIDLTPKTLFNFIHDSSQSWTAWAPSTPRYAKKSEKKRGKCTPWSFYLN